MTHFSYTVNQSVWVYPERANGLVEMRRKIDTDKGLVNRYLVSFNNGSKAAWFNERSIEPCGQIPIQL